MSKLFIAVHVGAGFHTQKHEEKYNLICKKACEIGMRTLKRGASSWKAIEDSISFLEDQKTTNAGLGSNLTIEGKVECDASIMSGDDFQFGSIGATPSIKNPIKVAVGLLEQNKRGLLSNGRIPPMLLVGEQAAKWGQKNNFEIVDNHELITAKSLRMHQKYMHVLNNNKHNSEEDDVLNDTVGAICLDVKGNLSSGVSSGGILLKFPGRVGEAAIWGAGCWAQNATSTKYGVACSTSGTGEQIMRTNFSKTCSARLISEDDLHSSLKKALEIDFLKSATISIFPEKYVGVIAVRTIIKNEKLNLEFWYGHTTPSMGIGYLSSKMDTPNTFVSRKSSSNCMEIKIDGSSIKL